MTTDKLHFDEAVRIATIRRYLSNQMPAMTGRAAKNLDVLMGLDGQIEQLARIAGVALKDVYDVVPLIKRPTLQDLANETTIWVIRIVGPAGRVTYYTGKGESTDLEKAFPYQTEEGVSRKADFLRQRLGNVIVECLRYGEEI